MHCPLDGIVHVRLDDMAGRMTHAAKLLRILGRGEEPNPVLGHPASQDDGKLGAFEFDPLDHGCSFGTRGVLAV
jgi:hypothetical protein